MNILILHTIIYHVQFQQCRKKECNKNYHTKFKNYFDTQIIHRPERGKFLVILYRVNLEPTITKSVHYKAKQCDEESWLLSQQTSDSHEMCASVVPVWPVLGTHRTSLGSQLSSRRILVTTNGECHSLQQTIKRLCFSIYLGEFGFAAVISICFTF